MIDKDIDTEPQKPRYGVNDDNSGNKIKIEVKRNNYNHTINIKN